MLEVKESKDHKVITDSENPRIYIEYWRCKGCGKWVNVDETLWVNPKTGEATTGEDGAPYHESCAPPEGNSNVLADVECPKCGSLGPFVICGEIFALVSDDGIEDTWDFEWQPGSYCRCRECDYAGIVGEFILPHLLKDEPNPGMMTQELFDQFMQEGE